MNKLTATILSTISLSGAALIAAALLSTTTAHSAPASKVATGDVEIGTVSVVEDMGGSAVAVSAPVRKAPKAARPFEMTHVSRVASSEVIVHPATKVAHYTFDVDVSL